MYRIIYDTRNGKIHSSRRIPDSALANNTRGEHIGYINGFCPNPQEYKINLDTLALEKIEISINPYVYLRQHRNAKLQFRDWTQAVDSPLTDAKKTEWATYRQALRDLPNGITLNTIGDIVWPNEPE